MILLCCLLLAALSRPIQGQDVTIKVEGFDNNVPLEVSSGWPLTIELYANNPEPIVYSRHADGLNSVPFNDGNSIQFQPGTVPSTTVNSPPQLFVDTGSAHSLVSLPPLSGGNYGANAKLPGLVIVTDAGTGLVFNPKFKLVKPLEERNLAGFLSSILYTFNNGNATPSQTGQLVITVQMAVPPELFVPIVEVDDNVGTNGGFCPDGRGICSTATWMWRIDGGQDATGSVFDLANALAQKITNVRIFVVEGNAPDSLTDLNGDGVVDITDAQLAGYKMLSNEMRIQIRNLRQTHGRFPPPGFPNFCTNTVVFEGSIRTDLDGNGFVTNGLFEGSGTQCQLSSTHITPVPR